jgi:RNA polymerase sigma factor for flagellar operon FliA
MINLSLCATGSTIGSPEYLEFEGDISKSERKEIIGQLAQRMARFSEIQKKILALYYHEEMTFSEIATLFGLSESRVIQIYEKTLGLLRIHLSNLLTTLNHG